MASWESFAASSPSMRATRVSPKSIPAVTPPPVALFRSMHTRSLDTSTPNRANWSRVAQWVAAR